MDNELEALLEKQRHIFAALLGLARQQRDAIRDGAPEETLAALLADRGRLLQQSAAVDARLREAARAAGPAGEERITVLQALLREILELDDESGRLLQGRKSGIAEQMESMNRSASALKKGYGGQPDGGQGRFISRKG